MRVKRRSNALCSLFFSLSLPLFLSHLRTVRLPGGRTSVPFGTRSTVIIKIRVNALWFLGRCVWPWCIKIQQIHTEHLLDGGEREDRRVGRGRCCDDKKKKEKKIDITPSPRLPPFFISVATTYVLERIFMLNIFMLFISSRLKKGDIQQKQNGPLLPKINTLSVIITTKF